MAPPITEPALSGPESHPVHWSRELLELCGISLQEKSPRDFWLVLFPSSGMSFLGNSYFSGRGLLFQHPDSQTERRVSPQSARISTRSFRVLLKNSYMNCAHCHAEIPLAKTLGQKLGLRVFVSIIDNLLNCY